MESKNILVFQMINALIVPGFPHVVDSRQTILEPDQHSTSTHFCLKLLIFARAMLRYFRSGYKQ
jgi:hypothetical protein